MAIRMLRFPSGYSSTRYEHVVLLSACRDKILPSFLKREKPKAVRFQACMMRFEKVIFHNDAWKK